MLEWGNAGIDGTISSRHKPMEPKVQGRMSAILTSHSSFWKTHLADLDENLAFLNVRGTFVIPRKKTGDSAIGWWDLTRVRIT